MSVWLLLLLLSLIVAILAIIDISSGKVTFDGIKDHKHYAAIIVAACFAMAATLITAIQVASHRRYWAIPRIQIKIVRIILMVPIYAWSAWFGLVFVQLATYIDFIRVCYEAFVIFNFLLLLTRYLGGHEGAVAILQRSKDQEMSWPAPCCCCPRFHFSANFLFHIKRGTLQYVIFSPLAAFAAVILGALGYYDDGNFNFNQGYVYIALVQNCTQMVALYCLIWFYLVAKDDLAPFKPFAKFLVVKSVVFFTFWQGILINVLAKLGVIYDTGGFSAAQIQLGLQDFIICIEMLIAAAVHRWTFGVEPFRDGDIAKTLDEIRHRRQQTLGLSSSERSSPLESDLATVNPPFSFQALEEHASVQDALADDEDVVLEEVHQSAPSDSL